MYSKLIVIATGVALHAATAQAACTRPSTAGYDFGSVVETQLAQGGTFDVTGVTCATGTTGAASAATCPSDNTAYVVSGCTATTTCTRPSTTGYTITADGDDVTIAGWDATNFAATCATGYTGQPTAATCDMTISAAYVVSGCSATTTCTRPSTTGYTITADGDDVTIAGWDDNNFAATCATGYTGSPTAATCDMTISAAYVVSGCNANSCTGGTLTQPSNGVETGTVADPIVTGTDVTANIVGAAGYTCTGTALAVCTTAGANAVTTTGRTCTATPTTTAAPTSNTTAAPEPETPAPAPATLPDNSASTEITSVIAVVTVIAAALAGL